MGALIASLFTLIGVFINLKHSGQRDDARMKQDRELKDLELKAVGENRLRDERKLAYARLAAATSTIAMERDLLNNNTLKVSESMSETQLVAGSEKVKEAASNLYKQHEKTVEIGIQLRSNGQDFDENVDFQASREALEVTMFSFLEAAREELSIDPHTTDLITSTDSEAG